jgi:hypothetical protein
MTFFNSATAGNANINNNASLQFQATSTAGSATIGNNNTMTFFNSAAAGNANIENNFMLTFQDTSPFFYTIFIFRRAVLSLFIDWTRVYFSGVEFLKLCDAK